MILFIAGLVSNIASIVTFLSADMRKQTFNQLLAILAALDILWVCRFIFSIYLCIIFINALKWVVQICLWKEILCLFSLNFGSTSEHQLVYFINHFIHVNISQTSKWKMSKQLFIFTKLFSQVHSDQCSRPCKRHAAPGQGPGVCLNFPLGAVCSLVIK